MAIKQEIEFAKEVRFRHSLKRNLLVIWTSCYYEVRRSVSIEKSRWPSRILHAQRVAFRWRSNRRDAENQAETRPSSKDILRSLLRGSTHAR